MKWPKVIVILSLIFLLFLLFSEFVFTSALAQDFSTKTIDARIKISVCGDGTTEGVEDCDNGLSGKTCLDLGYVSGDLKCDIACGFDVSDCLPVPTSTPTPIPPTPAVTASSSVASSAVPSTPTPTSISKKPTTKPNLPFLIRVFDIDGDDKIEADELFPSIKLWVGEWRNVLLKASVEGKKCDLNNDNKCDLKDFSILMYYVGR